MGFWESDHGDSISVNQWGHIAINDLDTGQAVYVFPSTAQVGEFIAEVAAVHGLAPVNPAGEEER